MLRRDFVRLAGAGLTAGAAAVSHSVRRVDARDASAAPAPKPTLMKVGTQHVSSDETLALLAAFGVDNICSRLPSPKLDEAWSVDGLSRLRERVEKAGISLDMVPLPLSSNEISRSESPNILLGKMPERDREIDAICEMIRNTARAGIPSLKYNLTFLGVPRTTPTPGRGGARYSTFSYADGKQD